MSLLIIGTLSNDLEQDLPPSLFLECDTVADLRAYFAGIFPPRTAQAQSSIPNLQPAPLSSQAGAIEEGLVPSSDPLIGVRIQPPVHLQKGAGPNLFLCPDGSGAAAAYASIEDVGFNLFGLNSPFMSDCSKWTQGVHQLALAYMSSIRLVQPQGPYRIG